MIKLLIVARCIPEDIYLQSLDAPAKSILAGEKRFQIVVRDPEEWFIGRLALEIKNRYENLYKRDFGTIKYLKDAEDDCDLDPSLTVADLLVDEGKAAKDGADQKRVVKVIQEGGRAIRQGSVIPDLSATIYQPPSKPPVPIFPGIEKRQSDILPAERPNKRVRLGQIDEESEIVPSIEDRTHVQENGRRSVSHFELADARYLDSLNGTSNPNNEEVKQESPENARRWVNDAPATRDELEILPQRPTDWGNRGSKSHTAARQQVQSIAQHEQITSISTNKGTPPQSAQTPVSPPITEHVHTPAGKSVSLLNGMSGGEPITKSASKYRGRGDPYEFEESDIDDSQMSPRSKATRTKITPKLVPSSRSKLNVPSALPKFKPIPTGNNTGTASASNSRSWTRDGFQNLPIQPDSGLKRSRQTSSSSASDSRPRGIASLTAAKKQRTEKESESKSRSRSSSIASTNTGDSSKKTGESASESSRDSASAQLEENLRQSSPAKAPQLKTVPAGKAATRPRDKSPSADVARLPDSVSDGEYDPPLKTPKRPRRATKSTSVVKKEDPNEERCYRCWTKRIACDNAQPKCHGCLRGKRNCQYYRMTKDEAEREQEGRQAKTNYPPKESMIHPESLAARKRKAEDEADNSSGSEEDDAEEEGEEQESELQEELEDEEDHGSESIDGQPAVQATTTANKGKQAAESDGEESQDEGSDDNASEVEDDTSSPPTSAQQGLRKQDLSTSASSSTASKAQSPGPSNLLKAIVVVPNTQLSNNEDNPIERAIESEATTSNIIDKSQIEPPTQPVVNRNLTVQAAASIDRDKSPTVILPPGMTQEEYDKMLTQRSTMTEEQRKQQKLEARKKQPSTEAQKRGKDKKSTISPPAEPKAKATPKPPTSAKAQAPILSMSTPASKSVAPSSSAKSALHVSSTKPTPQFITKSTTTPAKPTPVKSNPNKTSLQQSSSNLAPNTPSKTIPHLSSPAPTTFIPSIIPPSPSSNRISPISRIEQRQKPHPKIATTANSVISKAHSNPPFRQPRTNSANIAAIPSEIPSLDTAKSVKALRDALIQGSQAGSGASTPQTKTKIFGKQVESESEDSESEDSDSDDSGSEEEKSLVPRVIQREASLSSDGSVSE